MNDVEGEGFHISGFYPVHGSVVSQYEVVTKFGVYIKIDFNSYYLGVLGCAHCRAWDTSVELVEDAGPIRFKCSECRRPWPLGDDLLHHLGEGANRDLFEAWLLAGTCDPFRAVFVAEELNARLEELLNRYRREVEEQESGESNPLASRKKHATPQR